MKKRLSTITNIPKNLALILIGAYQFLLSPDHSWLKVRFPHGYCRFYPSCSEYSRQAISKFGLIKGGFLSAKRLLRCHPFSEPSVDPVPNS